MDLSRNVFKSAIYAKRVQIGLWCSLCSNIGAEILADSGFDWILIDTEHAPNELPSVLTQLQAITRGTATPIIRPAWNDPVLIKRLLDIGAQTLLVPFVQDETEAARAVASCRYPPGGIRGVTTASRAARFGRIGNYLSEADREICVLVQVESLDALDRLEAIAATDGVDGVFIGPSDLSASMGHIGNPLHPEVHRVIESAVKRITAAGKAAGILTTVEMDARRYIDLGYHFVAVGSDVALLAKTADALAGKAKSWLTS